MIAGHQRKIPRLPLEGEIDLTYRCNNDCRHCWTILPAQSPARQKELSFKEIRVIADAARSWGCRRWSISGGEPLLRPDFPEIFDYLTRKAVSYTLNTNGTLITPAIARLLKRKGTKLVALYGATAKVHDNVTRQPGSFEATLRGMARLKEAGAGFMVQLIPLKANFHQWPLMVRLAQRLSPGYRVGASWLYLSACGSASRNREIIRQRLDASTVTILDPPNPLEVDGNVMKGAVLGAAGFQRESNLAMGQLQGGEMARREVAPYVGPDPRSERGKLACHALRVASGHWGLCHGAGMTERNQIPACAETCGAESLFAGCIGERREFHIDPYGGMSFCCFIKDPALRYDLRQGAFAEAWEEFIPGLADKVRGGSEYAENCGKCELRDNCRWCPVYAYLEHGRYSAKVEYLCEVARASRRFLETRRKHYRRFYQIAGITIQVDADLPITSETFAPKFRNFQAPGRGADTIMIQHHFSLPKLDGRELGKEVYRKPPWAIYQRGRSWIYAGVQAGKPRWHSLAVFNHDHTRGQIYHRSAEAFRQKNLNALTMFPTDQILIARVLADRQACYLHAAGMILDGKGLLFAGHSEAGKSTLVEKLQGAAEILGDDRMIVRGWPEGFRIHGTWSNGRVPIVSAASAPLSAIMFLEKSDTTALIRISELKEIVRRLLFLVIKPLATADWWEKILLLAGKVAREVPAYRLQSDKSGQVVELLKRCNGFSAEFVG